MLKVELLESDINYQLIIENRLFCKLIPIPAGHLRREDGATVTLSSFYMAECQVTQEFYAAVSGKNPSSFTGVQHPVERVSWYDAIRFCGLLNKELNVNSELLKLYTLSEKGLDRFKLNPSSRGFRLPTESEWEYSAKGGNSEYKYSGNDTLDLVGWYKVNSGDETKPVGRKIPNSFGLFDMSGNVWEWCWDWYGEYSKRGLNNPVGTNRGSFRVLRGGSWDDSAAYCRSTYRGNDPPDYRNFIIGFRIVFVP